MSQEEEIVPLRGGRGRVPPVTHVRSTLISASILAFRAHGHFEEYLARLPKELHETILHLVAGVWLPIEIATAHYQALESIGMSPQRVFEIGREVADRIQGSNLGTIARMAKGVGMTPWTGLPHFQRLWDRLVQGGGGAVYRVGPKEARIEGHGLPFARFTYVRAGFRGMIAGSADLFCQKAYVTEIPRLSSPLSFAYRLAWA